MHVVTDDELRRLPAAAAVRWMREALVAHHEGRLTAPPRVQASVDDGRLTFTCGSLAGQWFGYRSYLSPGAGEGEQVVVVQRSSDRTVRAMSVGSELGPRRVGAIGGVAVDALASSGASVLGIVGTGAQAWCQLWAVSSVRRFADVRVFARDPQRRQAFCDRAATELGLCVRGVDAVEDAVRDAHVVVTATSSGSPVLSADWLAPGAHVTTLGPKHVGRHEFGLDLAGWADLLVTDSREQVGALTPPHLLVGTEWEDGLVELGAVVAGTAAGRRSGEDRTAFFSVGLAGTEAYLLDRLSP